MENILEVKNICFSYHTLFGETPALNNISFVLPRGCFMAIVGPSGCGKSTLLSIIAGLLSAYSGKVIRKETDKIGYMLQKDTLFEWKSVYKNACLGPEINHCLNNEKIKYIDRLFEEYHLADFKDKRPSELSGGMKQRVALIRTLAMEPELLLLDEPFSALDYQTRLTVAGDISSLIKRSGKSAIMITHDIGEAISVADKILILTKRPASVCKETDIKLTIANSSPLSARNAPEYTQYFNMIWEELNHA